MSDQDGDSIEEMADEFRSSGILHRLADFIDGMDVGNSGCLFLLIALPLVILLIGGLHFLIGFLLGKAVEWIAGQQIVWKGLGIEIWLGILAVMLGLLSGGGGGSS